MSAIASTGFAAKRCARAGRVRRRTTRSVCNV
jgi:hypothetical protein